MKSSVDTKRNCCHHHPHMASCIPAVGAGLVVTAKQIYYPIELSNAELLAHYETIQEYHNEISANVLAKSSKFKPDCKLIDQQPEMNPLRTRSLIVSFLYELSVMARVTDGIFYHAVRLYDRYCSKRIVLKDQSKLVVATCLWLAAKTWGGCNHIINNVAVPTGGRFYGPNPRARIPRLSELVHYCGGPDVFDESMFMQMERHILDTLSWDVYEPMINDYVLNVDENCLIQYELYKRQLELNKINRQKHKSQSSQDSDATVDESEQDMEDEDEELQMKIELINLKKFLIDLSAWQYTFLKFEMFEISNGIFNMIGKFTPHDQGPLLSMPSGNENDTQVMNIFMHAITKIPKPLYEIYKTKKGITKFIARVTDYQAHLQKQLQLDSAMDLSRISVGLLNRTVDPTSSSPSSTMYSPVQSNRTPIGNASVHSDTSIFSVVEHISPITPQMYRFVHPITTTNSNSTNESDCISVNSISRRLEDNKENMAPYHQQVSKAQLPPKARFINNGGFSSPNSSHTSSSNRSSLVSLVVNNLHQNV